MPHAMSRTRLPLLGAAAAALLLAPAAARADFVPSTPIDGPSAAIVGRPDVDMARDGTGAVAYERTDGVYVSRFLGGAWQPPVRVGAGSSPAVAASDGGRVLVAWDAAGVLAATVAPDGRSGFGPAQPLAAGGTAPSADMSINGVGYVSFTVPGATGTGGDVRAARLDRLGTSLAVLPEVLDLDPSRDAGTGGGRSQVSVSADGSALVVWGEAGAIGARRVFKTAASNAPQLVSVPQVGTHIGGVADLPEVDIEDDSSFAWVSYRQRLEDGRVHLVAARQVGSAFDPPIIADNLGFPAGADVVGGGVAINGRGEGLSYVNAAGGGVVGSVLHDDTIFPPVGLGAGGPGGSVAAALGETNDSPTAEYLAASGADGLVRVTSWRIDPAKRTVSAPQGTAVVSAPALGAIDEGAGLDAGGDRAGDMVAVFVQGTGDGRRLVAGSFDRPPGAFGLSTSSSFRNSARPTLSWGTSFELWGPIGYEVAVDGKVVAQTTQTSLQLPVALATGDHRVTITAVDRVGQRTPSTTRTVRIDVTAPKATFSISGTKRARRALKLTVRASDGAKGSGIARTRIDWGDGTRVDAGTATHAYARAGTYTVRVSATDRAGNARAVTRRVKIGR